MKGQANFIDFVIALGIFLLILFIFINFNQSQKTDFLLMDEALMISDAILSPGIPLNWTETEYYRPGIMQNNSLSAQRWESLNNIMLVNSTELKSRYTLLSDFMLRLGNYTDGVFVVTEINGISYITTDSSITPGNIMDQSFRRIDRIERAVSFNGSILIMEVIAWR